MAEVSSRFVSVPHLVGSTRTQGFLATWTELCDHCDRQCEKSAAVELSVCSYGVNSQRISKDFLLFGFLVQGPTTNGAQRKALKHNPNSLIKPILLQTTTEILLSDKRAHTDTRAKALRNVVEEFRSSAMYKTELLELLKPEIKKNLAFLHDYRQFVARVKQNINVVLETRFPGEGVDVQLQRASKAEAAIYWSAALMDDKLKVAFLLTQPDRLASLDRTQFRVHG